MALQNLQRITREKPLLLWGSTFGSIAIWFIHFVFVWAAVEFGCAASLSGYNALSPGTINTLVLIGTVVAIVLLLIVGFSTFAVWRGGPDQEIETTELRAFMGLVGIALVVAGLAVVILSTVPVFVLRTCQGVAGG